MLTGGGLLEASVNDETKCDAFREGHATHTWWLLRERAYWSVHTRTSIIHHGYKKRSVNLLGNVRSSSASA